MKEFKVNEQEFKLINQIRNLKEKGFSNEDILQLDRNKEINKENMQKMRLETIETSTRRNKHYRRSIENKKQQITDNVSIEKHEGYIGDIKPLFMLENEIEEIEANIKQNEEINKLSQEEYDNDKKKK